MFTVVFTRASRRLCGILGKYSFVGPLAILTIWLKHVKNAWAHWGVLIYQRRFGNTVEKRYLRTYLFSNQCVWRCFLLFRHPLFLFKSRHHLFVVFMAKGISPWLVHILHLVVTHDTWLFGTCLCWNNTAHLACAAPRTTSWGLVTLYYSRCTSSLELSRNTSSLGCHCALSVMITNAALPQRMQ